MCELARERVTVALSGDGADEAFAGYRRHAFQPPRSGCAALLPGRRARAFGALGDRYPKLDWAPQRFRAKTTLQALGRAGEEAYARGGRRDPAATARAALQRRGARALGGHRAEDRYVAAMRAAPARDALDRAQYADLKIWLPGDILTKVDRTSMAVSLEAREPLLDHRLVEFAARLPASMRVRGGIGQMADEARARPLSARRDPPPPQDGLRHPDRRLVPRAAGRRGRGDRARLGAGRDRLVRCRARSPASPPTIARAAPIMAGCCGSC